MRNRTPAMMTASALVIVFGLLAACSPRAGSPALPTLPPAATTTLSPTPLPPLPTPSALPSATPSPGPTAAPTPLPLALALSETAAYRLPPTLRALTEQSASLFFELAQPAAGQVYVQPAAGGAVFSVPLIPGETRQNLLVSGLAPATAYHVLVALEENGALVEPHYDGRAWGPLGFTTPGGSAALRVGFISDASFGDATTNALVQAMAQADLDFVIHGGDVADAQENGLDPFAFYGQAFYTPFEPLLRQGPVYPIPGNHDYDADIRYEGQPFYFHAFPLAANALSGSPTMQYYAVVQNGIQFLFLDSQVLFGASGLAEQEAWLAQRLADESARFTVVVLHVAPFSSSSVHAEDSLPPQRRWVPQFEGGSVPLVLSGHFHHYERLQVNGITYLVAGGGSEVLYALGSYLPQSEVVLRQSHWVLLEFNQASIHIVAYGVEGQVLDESYVMLAE
jgi:predicted phosphodiesterase